MECCCSLSLCHRVEHRIACRLGQYVPQGFNLGVVEFLVLGRGHWRSTVIPYGSDA